MREQPRPAAAAHLCIHLMRTPASRTHAARPRPGSVEGLRGLRNQPLTAAHGLADPQGVGSEPTLLRGPAEGCRKASRAAKLPLGVRHAVLWKSTPPKAGADARAARCSFWCARTRRLTSAGFPGCLAPSTRSYRQLSAPAFRPPVPTTYCQCTLWNDRAGLFGILNTNEEEVGHATFFFAEGKISMNDTK